jgi:hypothetical protein
MNDPSRTPTQPSPREPGTAPDDESIAGEEDPGAALDDFSLPPNPDVDPSASQPLPSDPRNPAAPGH